MALEFENSLMEKLLLKMFELELLQIKFYRMS